MAKKIETGAIGDMMAGGAAASSRRRELINQEAKEVQEAPKAEKKPRKKQIKNEKISIRLTPEVKARLEECAADQERTVSGMIAYFISEGLKNMEK